MIQEVLKSSSGPRALAVLLVMCILGGSIEALPPLWKTWMKFSAPSSSFSPTPANVGTGEQTNGWEHVLPPPSLSLPCLSN